MEQKDSFEKIEALGKRIEGLEKRIKEPEARFEEYRNSLISVGNGLFSLSAKQARNDYCPKCGQKLGEIHFKPNSPYYNSTIPVCKPNMVNQIQSQKIDDDEC